MNPLLYNSNQNSFFSNKTNLLIFKTILRKHNACLFIRIGLLEAARNRPDLLPPKQQYFLQKKPLFGNIVPDRDSGSVELAWSARKTRGVGPLFFGIPRAHPNGKNRQFFDC
jgi:hypothetical protein